MLHPKHEPRSVLDEIAREMGPIAFSAQYTAGADPAWGPYHQARVDTRGRGPTSGEDSDRLIVSWDIALSETEAGDYSAYAVLLKRGDRYHVLEVMRGRWRYDGRIVIEDSPISKGLIQSVRKQNINVEAVKPSIDKRARAIAQTNLFAGGSITFEAGTPWLPDLRAELLAFPGGKHDDQVDALIQGIAYGRETKWCDVVVRPVLEMY